MIRIILNGKKAGQADVRTAIDVIRQEHKGVTVRPTYEYGDVERLLQEALAEGVQRVVIGGGDGSVNEIVDAMARVSRQTRPELAILPLGTANDFATACRIPTNALKALRLAVSGSVTAIDIGKANKRHFINTATAGFGAQVTAETPVELKNFLGGGAYTLMGVMKAIHFTPYRGWLKTADLELTDGIIIGAVCNGRQAGGGQILAPNAYINDGLLDVITVSHFRVGDLAAVIEEIKRPSRHNRFVRAFQTPSLESESEESIPVNLDGEPYGSKHIRFEVLPGAIHLVLPSGCPLIR